jgi:hypothetical protein
MGFFRQKGRSYSVLSRGTDYCAVFYAEGRAKALKHNDDSREKCFEPW